MSDRSPFSEFISTLPEFVEVIAKRILRAIVRFAKQLAIHISNAVTATWRTYSRLELSVVDTIVAIVLVIWSVRLAALVVAPAILLALAGYWAGAAFYVAVLGFAIWKYYAATAEDISVAVTNLDPLRKFTASFVRWSLRTTLLLLSFIAAFAFVQSKGIQVRERDQRERPTEQLSRLEPTADTESTTVSAPGDDVPSSTKSEPLTSQPITIPLAGAYGTLAYQGSVKITYRQSSVEYTVQSLRLHYIDTASVNRTTEIHGARLELTATRKPPGGAESAPWIIVAKSAAPIDIKLSAADPEKLVPPIVLTLSALAVEMADHVGLGVSDTKLFWPLVVELKQ